MGAPRRIRTNIEGRVISAYVVREAKSRDETRIVCKSCAPNYTKMKLLGELTQHGFETDMSFAVFECQRCGTQWAVPYRVETTPAGTP